MSDWSLAQQLAFYLCGWVIVATLICVGGWQYGGANDRRWLVLSGAGFVLALLMIAVMLAPILK